MERPRPQLPGAVTATVTALLLTLATGCPRPGPDDGVLIGDGPSSTSTCGDAAGAMRAGDWAHAVERLRIQSASDPVFGATPGADLCLGRALVGTGALDEALALLVPLGEGLAFRQEERAAAWLYAVWAHATRGDWETAAAVANEASPLPTADNVLLASDGPAAELVLLGVDATAGRWDQAVVEAEALVRNAPGDGATQAWLRRFLFERIGSARPDQLDRLAVNGTALGQALAGYARLERAVEAGDWELVESLGPEARGWLRTVSANEQAGEVDRWLSRTAPSGAPLFGAVLPLSGSQRQAGRAILAGLLLAEDTFDSGSDGGRSRLFVADAGQTAGRAAAAVAELDARGVLAIIGPVDGASADAASAEASARGIPFISLADEPSERETDPWAFRLFPDASREAEALVELARARGWTRLAVAVRVPTPAYLERLWLSFDGAAREAGLSVAGPVRYLADDLQAEADRAAAELADREFDALLIVDGPDSATTLAAYLGVRNVWARSPGSHPAGERRYVVYLGNSFWHDPGFLAAGPDYLAGAVFPAWMPLEIGQASTSLFFERFEAIYSRRPGLLGAYAHDALAMLRLVVLDEGVLTRGGVREALESIDLVGGATGELRFGPDRVNQARPHLLEVGSDGFHPL